MDSAADRGPPRDPQTPITPQTPEPARGAVPHSVPDPAAQQASFLEPFERVFAAIKAMVSSYATLAVLDARRAAIQFGWLLGAGIFATILLVSAWLAAVIALAVWLFGEGLSWPAVLLIAAGLNIVGAAIVMWRVKSMFRHKPFEALLNQVKPSGPTIDR